MEILCSLPVLLLCLHLRCLGLYAHFRKLHFKKDFKYWSHDRKGVWDRTQSGDQMLVQQTSGHPFSKN